MVIIKLDANGDFQLAWDADDISAIALGKAYVAKEGMLPVAQQLKEPSLDMMRQAVTTAIAALEASTAGELQRAEAATRFHNIMNEATPLLSVIIDRLKGKYATDLGSLRRWGLDTKIGARGKVSVAKPKTEVKWADFMGAYVKHEAELPEAERIQDPPLARMTALSVAAEANREARRVGSIQRQAGTQTRSTSAAPLLDLLKVACGLLVVTRFGGQVTENLGEWGYKVVRRNGKPAEPPVPTPPQA